MVKTYALSTNHQNENYSISHQLETGQQQKNNKKATSELHIFVPFCKFLAQNTEIPIATKIHKLFQHLSNWHLMAQQTAQQ